MDFFSYTLHFFLLFSLSAFNLICLHCYCLMFSPWKNLLWNTNEILHFKVEHTAFRQERCTSLKQLLKESSRVHFLWDQSYLRGAALLNSWKLYLIIIQCCNTLPYLCILFYCGFCKVTLLLWTMSLRRHQENQWFPASDYKMITFFHLIARAGNST